MSDTKLVRRLALFLAPYAVGLLMFYGVGVISGEFVPVTAVAWAQTLGKPFLFLTQLSDHIYPLKVAAALWKAPDVLVIGSSRSNQWRSAMFKGSFYNSGGGVYTYRDGVQFVRSLGPRAPRAAIVSVDFFAFGADWDAEFAKLARKDIDILDVVEGARIGKKLAVQLRTNPRDVLKLHREPIYHLPAIGLYAARWGVGYRIDGSYQYGTDLQGLGNDGIMNALDRVRLGIPPFLKSATIDRWQMEAFAEFVGLARAKGITVIGVAMPFAPEVVRALNASPDHEMWRTFRTEAFRRWIRDRGVIYFDFTDLESFGGRREEFVDAFHPSEPAYVRMLLTMTANPLVREALQPASADMLAGELAQATRLEVFRNRF